MGSCCSVSSSKQVSAPKHLSKSKEIVSMTNTPQNSNSQVKNSKMQSSVKKGSQNSSTSKKKSQEGKNQGQARKDNWKTSLQKEKSVEERNGNEDQNAIKIIKPLDLKYKRGQIVGKGTLGEVYHCLNLNTGELMAVKTIQFPGSEAKAQSYCRMLQREFCIINQIPLLNIVRYYYVNIVESREKMSTIDIVFEYGSGGSIRSLLDRFQKLEEKTSAIYIRQVLETLCVLHECEIVHRDIKSSNILIDATGTIKLSDFGCCKWFDPPSNMPKDLETDIMKLVVVPIDGSVYWQAPEVVGGVSQGKPSDIWSIGCLLIEMLTGVPPWSQDTEASKDVESLILSGDAPPLPRNISEACSDFFKQVFQKDPDKRPTAEELLEHPYIKSLNFGLTVTETQMDDHPVIHQGEYPMEVYETKKIYSIPLVLKGILILDSI